MDLSTLDPHSRLLKPEDYREMKLSTRGKFGGLGIVINVQDGVLTVVRPIEDTPADRAGIQVGDKIVQIGLDSTVNMTLDEAVDLLNAATRVLRFGWREKVDNAEAVLAQTGQREGEEYRLSSSKEPNRLDSNPAQKHHHIGIEAGDDSFERSGRSVA